MQFEGQPLEQLNYFFNFPRFLFRKRGTYSRIQAQTYSRNTAIDLNPNQLHIEIK